MCAYVGVAFLKCFTGCEVRVETFYVLANIYKYKQRTYGFDEFFDDNGYTVDIGTKHNKKLDWLQTLIFLYRTKKDA